MWLRLLLLLRRQSLSRVRLLNWLLELGSAVAVVVDRRVVATLDHRVRHALVLVLVGVHVKRLAVRLGRNAAALGRVYNAGRHDLACWAVHGDRLLLGVLCVCGLAGQVLLVLSPGVC